MLIYLMIFLLRCIFIIAIARLFIITFGWILFIVFGWLGSIILGLICSIVFECIFFRRKTGKTTLPLRTTAFLTPQRAEEIKNANKVLWLRYYWSDKKTFEEKVNIVQITPELIFGYSHGWGGIQRFYYKQILEWKMLDEYVPGKEPFLKTEGNELYDTYAEKAIKLKRCMLIKYENGHGELSERKIDIYYSKYGYLHAWCHLRNKARTFKIGNVKEWKLLDEVFIRNPEIDACFKDKIKTSFF